MPTYQYTCTDCAEPLEIVQAFTDDAITLCPNCGGTLRKVFSAVGVVFKGSGFYRTDSRVGSGSSSTAGVPAPASASSDSSGDKGSNGDKGSTAPASTDSKPSTAPAPASTPAPSSTPAKSAS